jgi:uncharacterized protein YndB with AHSA1/START domain
MNERLEHVARASVTVESPREKVWKALVEPEAIRKYMMGANVVTDWREGSDIVWEGEYEGKPFRDKGTILRNEPERLLRYSHFSPLTGQADSPENYHTVTIELAADGDLTKVNLTQDNNDTAEARKDSEQNWKTMLDGLKEVAEAS